jgi:hypothetical protein
MKSAAVQEIPNGQISVMGGARILGGSPQMVQPLRMLTWAQSEYVVELDSDEGIHGTVDENENQVVAVEKAQSENDIQMVEWSHPKPKKVVLKRNTREPPQPTQ